VAVPDRGTAAFALAAWMLDDDARSDDDVAQAFVAGNPATVSSQTRSSTITMTLVTNTGISPLVSTGRRRSPSSMSGRGSRQLVLAGLRPAPDFVPRTAPRRRPKCR
jgi:hypothetical protein